MLSLFIAQILVCMLAGCFDFLFYKIPNLFVILIVVLFGFTAFFLPSLHIYSYVFGVTGIIFIISFIMYYMGWIGAGDAKFLSACSLWASLVDINYFLIISALGGGIIALIYTTLYVYIDQLRLYLINQCKHYFRYSSFMSYYIEQPFIFTSADSLKKIKTPYGVAITSGSFFIMVKLIKESF